jgi:hypothetical protein
MVYLAYFHCIVTLPRELIIQIFNSCTLRWMAPCATEVPLWWTRQTFEFCKCHCSRRTAKEEEEYGSYCADCWKVLKLIMKCSKCSISVKETRLIKLFSGHWYQRNCHWFFL